MPSLAKWGLTCIAAAIVSLIPLGLSGDVHAPTLAWRRRRVHSSRSFWQALPDPGAGRTRDG
jgi:hypothetical protein